VSEIAYELGFDYPQYFSRLFKRYVGVSPNEFRMMN
jgi:AraC-like DNA-binding protein